jgi:hypothetical protein
LDFHLLGEIFSLAYEPYPDKDNADYKIRYWLKRFKSGVFSKKPKRKFGRPRFEGYVFFDRRGRGKDAKR